jgi:hypothetical protein
MVCEITLFIKTNSDTLISSYHSISYLSYSLSTIEQDLKEIQLSHLTLSKTLKN